MMELFEPQRNPGEAAALAAKLKALGLRGRDASYLASILAPPPEAVPERRRYFEELAFMVPRAAHPAVRALLGLDGAETGSIRRAA